MAAEKDPAEVVRTIARSIQVSQRGARRVRARRFKELFGYQALSAQRRQRIEELLTEAGIVVQLPVSAAQPDPRPSEDWFEHMKSLRPDTEREVEMHFVAPLFRELGYLEDQEAAGFGIQVYQGSRRPQRIEADVLYFASEQHTLEEASRWCSSNASGLSRI
jgi:hypothetical protein